MRKLFLALLAFFAVPLFASPASSQSVAPQPTRKLCLPSNTVVPYSTACPAGTTGVKKICPYGQIVPYSTACPASPPSPPPPPLPPPPAPAPGTAVALSACQAIHNGDLLVVGQGYTIVGTAGYSQPGDPPTSAKDILILNDATHRGDGWFGLYVPAGCVTAG